MPAPRRTVRIKFLKESERAAIVCVRRAASRADIPAHSCALKAWRLRVPAVRFATPSDSFRASGPRSAMSPPDEVDVNEIRFRPSAKVRFKLLSPPVLQPHYRRPAAMTPSQMPMPKKA